MKELILKENDFIIALKTPDATCRIVREIGDGRLAILQIVNPENDPALAKWLRKKAEKNKAMKLAHALEVAKRVGGCAFRSAMRKKNERRGQENEEQKEQG